MSLFRKFLVRNFVLDYSLKLFGKIYQAPRASRIIFPVFVITGLLTATNENWPDPTLAVWIGYAATLIVLYFGFIHFHLSGNTVKWDELDRFQKWQYGLIKFDTLTSAQKDEWFEIVKSMK
ncbi:MAG: hypothetical protein ACOVOQ_16435 [Flavobacterium sp.]|jgi:hypothetical protein